MKPPNKSIAEQINVYSCIDIPIRIAVLTKVISMSSAKVHRTVQTVPLPGEVASRWLLCKVTKDPAFLERGFICIMVWGFAFLSLSHFSYIFHENEKKNGLTETKLFHFHRVLKNGDEEGGSIEPPEPPLDPPLTAPLINPVRKLGRSIWYVELSSTS